MTILASLSFRGYLEPVHFAAGGRILREGAPGDGCLIIQSGEVRVEVERPETDTDGVLGFLGPGEWLGELNLLDGEPRSASAYAHTAVTGGWLSSDALARLCAEDPREGLQLVQSLGHNAASRLRDVTRRLAGYAFDDEPDPAVDAMVTRAATAQRAFAEWSEDRVDEMLSDIANAISVSAEELAERTVAETRLGNVADKTIKNRFASLTVFESIKGRPAAGPIHIDETHRIVEIASPVGVVFGLVPQTNPVSTFVFKTLIALKGRNALILSCHRGAREVGFATGDLIQRVVARHGAPLNLVQTVGARASRRTTIRFMRHSGVGFILATGGTSMVHAAYSSGTPAIGVGPGNAPAWVCADADADLAARTIVMSKSFDNGIICGSEHNLVVDRSVRVAFVDALEARHAAVLSPGEAERFGATVFDAEDRFRREWLGQSADQIAAASGIGRPWPIRLIVVPVARSALQSGYAREKLAPVLSLFEADGDEDGIGICQTIVAGEGMGHTAIIHTLDPARIEHFASRLSASRILVNGPGSQGCIGLGNGLAPSLTLGCGTFGGTSTTDNVTYTHLLNIKRVAFSVWPSSEAAPPHILDKPGFVHAPTSASGRRNTVWPC